MHKMHKDHRASITLCKRNSILPQIFMLNFKRHPSKRHQLMSAHSNPPAKKGDNLTPVEVCDKVLILLNSNFTLFPSAAASLEMCLFIMRALAKMSKCAKHH